MSLSKKIKNAKESDILTRGISENELANIKEQALKEARLEISKMDELLIEKKASMVSPS